MSYEFEDSLYRGGGTELAEENAARAVIEKISSQDAEELAFWEGLETGTGTFGHASLTKAEIHELTGMEFADADFRKPSLLEQINDAPINAPLSGLTTFIKSGDSTVQAAYKNLEKSYRRQPSLRAAMESTSEVFSEHFSADQRLSLQRAIDCLDVGSFLTVLAAGMRAARKSF
jgi:hypothetical protein